MRRRGTRTSSWASTGDCALIERDEEIHGKNSNAKMFVLRLRRRGVERRGGEVDQAGASSAASRSSSSASARWPAARCRSSRTRRARSSSIRRRRRRRISTAPACSGSRLAGAGQYFELDRDGDRHIANAIIDAGKQMAPSLGAIQESEDLYWRFLVIAPLFPFIGLLFLRDRPELWLQVIGVAAALTVVSIILG